eukprot:8325845-Alexandrium_andersonii.AAC.1
MASATYTWLDPCVHVAAARVRHTTVSLLSNTVGFVLLPALSLQYSLGKVQETRHYGAGRE